MAHGLSILFNIIMIGVGFIRKLDIGLGQGFSNFQLETRLAFRSTKSKSTNNEHLRCKLA